MNHRGHLPAGQPMQGSVDMGPVPGGGQAPVHGHNHGHGHGHGLRRAGRPQHYANAHHYPQHVNQQPMYPQNYMTPYGGAPYYIQPHYQNGAMAAPTYMAYPPAGYNRSPPSMQHYVPLVPQNYSRPPQQSPIVASSYQIPPPLAVTPILPPTPSSTHSQNGLQPPMTPPVVQQMQEAVQVQVEPQPRSQPQLEPQLELQSPKPPQSPQSPPPAQIQTSSSEVPSMRSFRLPWYSHPDLPFPSRTTRSRRRRKALDVDFERVEHSQLASLTDLATEAQPGASVNSEASQVPEANDDQASATTPKVSSKAPALEPRSETPSTQDHPSEETTSTSPTTPSSVQPPLSSASTAITPSKPAKPVSRPTIPAVPIIPVLPKTSPKATKPPSSVEKSTVEAGATPAALVGVEKQPETAKDANGTSQESSSETAQAAPAPAKPLLWTGLFSKPAAAAGSVSSVAAASQAQTNGDAAADGSSGVSGAVGGFGKGNNSLAEALQTFRVGGEGKLAFLEPRGLVNTGNMCYMNSVLQVLVFCVPFYDFLDQVSKKAAHSFKSDTPLLDAIILFMREFKVIDSTVSVDQLRRRLKSEELEQYGEQFIPEFVYDAIRRLPRFASMRRGHQQDAEEFLGFLLDGLHEECAQVIRAASVSTASTAPNSSLPSPTFSRANEAEGGDDWLEVGPRQRAAVTRSSGYPNVSSPITKIFGGQLRSELRVPGVKTSVTLEPYQPLQLDIGASEVRNIVDALKGLTRPESLHGDFNSPLGKDVKATKQIFIESLPSVLILHLKRFQFDAEGGTIKIWKNVGYPLELEIPREILSRQKRNTVLTDAAGLPRYRLISVVYHHGKNASGGHYTVDVRRQDGREWIRIDDTVIRRVRSEEVAEGGAEEDTVKSTGADGRKENNNSAMGNRFSGIDDEQTGADDGWKQATAGGKKWSSVVNGAPSSSSTNGPKAKQYKDNIKDNKVAYLLFYQRI
ncbi:hypothetical protein B0H66DRAFT_599907 [Apodospora peruviana]|uniref:Ubiquitin carboxyl-terminal hydrolase n=1 Tax=Apodospora peruviana TaxID=516989 RepID=A0AAE0IIV3_9PEZI|nr:hypothetical protein B0H66DRAFT_599907 [Apodospora peruviana]